jgi:hypothetical protein
MMDKQEKTGQHGENIDKINKIASDIIEPALKNVLAEARKEASAEEVMSALANSYAGLLVDTMGRKAAVAFLQGHANHIASLEEEALSH